MAIGARILAALALMLVVDPAWAQSSPPVGAILTLLRAGGYVVVFRHGATHADQADTNPLNLDDQLGRLHRAIEPAGDGLADRHPGGL
jgi:hypothetical protein